MAGMLSQRPDDLTIKPFLFIEDVLAISGTDQHHAGQKLAGPYAGAAA